MSTNEKCFWLLIDNNKKYDIRYNIKLNGLSEPDKECLILGPFTKDDLMEKITNSSLIYENKEYKYWVLKKDNRFEIFKGTEYLARSEAMMYSIENKVAANVQCGPFNDEQETKETINVLRYCNGETHIPVYWVLRENCSDYYEIFFGNKEQLDIKTHNRTQKTVCSIESTYKRALKKFNELTQGNQIEHSEIRHYWITRTIKMVHGVRIEDLREYISKSNSSDNSEFVELISGPFYYNEASDAIKQLKGEGNERY
jgi:hypothetical protein